MATVNGVTETLNYYRSEESGSNTMGKDDFLKLLVAQLTHQDPTNPMQDTEFVSQLATYSGLEQQMNMNKNLESLININLANTSASAVNLIGHIVGYRDDEGVLQTGQVNFVDIQGGEVYLILWENNTPVPFNKIEYVGKPIYVDPDEETEDPPAGGGTGDDNKTETTP